MKKLITLVAVIGAFSILASQVSADCTGQYGQYGEPCNSYALIVDKMVAKPGTSNYVDNLSVSDPRFAPSQDVWFKIRVKNTSTTTLGGLQVKDYVPSYLTPVEGPGVFDTNTRTITWDAGFFNVDEEKTYYLKMKVSDQADLPSNQSLICVINKAEASSNTTVDDDSSQLCIEKKVLGASTVPSTGPELGIFLLAGNLLGAGIGLKLRKRS